MKLIRSCLLGVILILQAIILHAGVGIDLSPNSWEIGKAGKGEWVSQEFIAKNIGDEPARLKISASNTENWLIGNEPGLDRFRIDYGDATRWNVICATQQVMVPVLTNSGETKFKYRLQSPLSVSNIDLPSQQRINVTLTVSLVDKYSPATAYEYMGNIDCVLSPNGFNLLAIDDSSLGRMPAVYETKGSELLQKYRASDGSSMGTWEFNDIKDLTVDRFGYVYL